ncbi:MAG: hypothetical protein DHS20C15_20500 [Planctomycetota bacterium]|nr:MAG: hypothetical protein DHS20C15_20500 [Planctomycetota bacterium]
MKTPTLSLLLLAAVSCGALAPRLPPKLPPPNLPRGMLVLDLTDAEAGKLETRDVVQLREAGIEELARADPAAAAHVLAHRVVTGMRVREVLWSLSGHPTRVRELGPPGGQILLFQPGRWYVRFGDEGTVVDGGRF